jgi:hypothetical protein
LDLWDQMCFRPNFHRIIERKSKISDWAGKEGWKHMTATYEKNASSSMLRPLSSGDVGAIHKVEQIIRDMRAGYHLEFGAESSGTNNFAGRLSRSISSLVSFYGIRIFFDSWFSIFEIEFREMQYKRSIWL